MTSDDTRITDTSTELDSGLGDESTSVSEIDSAKAQQGVKLLLEAVGADPTAEELQETWQRRVPQLLETLTEGTRETAKPTLRAFETNNRELVIKTGIPLYSLCEHHLLPYYGTAHVAYRPTGKAVGLSKLTRYIRWHSRRFTMQEQLTQDIAAGLADELDSAPVLVELRATHLCEAMRGVETASETTTRATVGEPDDEIKTRFTQAITRSQH